MNPKLILLIIILITPFVFAEVECSKVLIVKFNYDNGLIAYKDKVIKCGYAPDRKIQPEYGYKAEILSVNNEPLYSFKFEIPLNLYLDISDPLVKSLSGGLLILNETDFALIFPYYDTAKSMVIYNEREYNILIVPLTEEIIFNRKERNSNNENLINRV